MRLVPWGIVTAIVFCGSIVNGQTSQPKSGLLLRGSVYRHYRVRDKKKDERSERNFRVVWIALEYVNEGNTSIFIPTRFLTQEVAFYDTSRHYLLPARYIGQTSVPNIDPLKAATTFLDDSRILSSGERFAFTAGISVCVTRDVDESDLGCGGTYEAGSEKEADELLTRAYVGIRLRTIDFGKHFPGFLESLADRWNEYGILPLDNQGEFVIESAPIENLTRTLAPEETVYPETGEREKW